MTQQEKALILPKGKDILTWKIKTLARSPREMMI
ncbi:permease, partial [Pseudomonas syringae pv. actinidifoliorum]|nr:permease [Pseudomonas syringae pv. actinidifoliorum]